MRNKQIIHFIGIGGIGVSGLASIYLEKGYFVQGSDLEDSEITKALRDQGARVFIGHDKENLIVSTTDKQCSSRGSSAQNCGLLRDYFARQRRTRNDTRLDLVIYSEAVPDDNPELLEAKKLNIKCLSNAEALSQFAKNFFTIAVSGMHGKTTTSSMIAQVMIKAGLDPTFIIGTKPGWRFGKSKFLIIEADDYKEKFLNYYPNILVLTNIEEEHLDYFKNLDHILEIFQKYVKQVQDLIIYNKQDKNILKIIGSAKCKTIAYNTLRNIKLGVPGTHNQSNASATLELARALKINDKITMQALEEYKGVWRRFEQRCILQGAIVIDDYAHHPTEIKATLQAAREKYPHKKIIAIFQPHHYQRTRILFNDFTKSFDGADCVIITDVYSVAGREKDMTPTGRDLANATQGAEYVPLQKLSNWIKKTAKAGQVILIIGAGDIYNIKL